MMMNTKGCVAAQSEYPDYPSKIAFDVSESLFDKMIQAKNFSLLIDRTSNGPIENMVDDLRNAHARFDGWGDFRDQTLVAKADGVCYAAFMATSGEVLGSIQNANFIPRLVNGRAVWRAFWASYQSVVCRDKFNKALKGCAESCKETQCPLILTGFSKGGAAAVVGSIDLEHYNPTAIAFGAPKAVCNFQKCNAINPSKHF